MSAPAAPFFICDARYAAARSSVYCWLSRTTASMSAASAGTSCRNLKHHLHRLGVVVNRRDHGDGVRTDLELSRRACARQGCVGFERGVETVSIGIHGGRASQILLPGFGKSRGHWSGSGLVELGALTEAVGLTTCFPARAQSRAGRSNRRERRSPPLRRRGMCWRRESSVPRGMDSKSPKTSSSTMRAAQEAGHTEAATAAASRRAGAAVDPSWGRRYHRPHAIRDPGDGSLHVKDGTLNWSSRFSAHAHVVTIALPHGR